MRVVYYVTIPLVTLVTLATLVTIVVVYKRQNHQIETSHREVVHIATIAPIRVRSATDVEKFI